MKLGDESAMGTELDRSRPNCPAMSFEAEFVGPGIARVVEKISATRQYPTTHKVQRVRREDPRGGRWAMLDKDLVGGHVKMAM